MDTSAADITFDADGRCSYCSSFAVAWRRHQESKHASGSLGHLVQQIRQTASSRKNRYDCVVGVSGGVDSSFVLAKAVELGLRPLAVHVDNGWNSELAVSNIHNLVNTLQVDLVTHVIDWPSVKDLQRALFAADVVDLEMATDNAILAINYSIAKKHQIKYILGGTNFSTEGMKCPPNWSWHKRDKKNLLNIHRRFGTRKIDYPLISSIDLFIYEHFYHIKWTSLLNHLEYDKEQALNLLESKYKYRRYAQKHFESIFTRYYQAQILPTKFRFDKRRLHYSTLITTNQLSREDALHALAQPQYRTKEEEISDRKFVEKKLGFSSIELDDYLSRPPVSHLQYGSETQSFSQLFKIYKRLFGNRKGVSLEYTATKSN